MTSRDLFNELSNIDESLIEEAGNVKMKEVQPMKKNYLKYMWPVAAAAACVLIVAGSIISINFLHNRFAIGVDDSSKIAAKSADEYIYVDKSLPENEMHVVYAKDMIYFEGNTYYLIDGVLEKDIWIGESGQNPEYSASDYAGYPVYLVKGRKGTYKLVLQKGDEEYVFRLYEWGDEPNMQEYARVYGVTEASDIVSVKLEWDYVVNKGYTGNAVISDSESLKSFYDIFFNLALDSDGYKKIVDKMSAEDIKAWREAGGDKVYEDENGGQYMVGYSGTTAFGNDMKITIRTADNEEVSFSYYPKIGYVNRFMATDELVDWLDTHKKAQTVAYR